MIPTTPVPVGVAELGERRRSRRLEAARRLLNDIVAGLGADAAVRGGRVRAPR